MNSAQKRLWQAARRRRTFDRVVTLFTWIMITGTVLMFIVKLSDSIPL